MISHLCQVYQCWSSHQISLYVFSFVVVVFCSLILENDVFMLLRLIVSDIFFSFLGNHSERNFSCNLFSLLRNSTKSLGILSLMISFVVMWYKQGLLLYTAGFVLFWSACIASYFECYFHLSRLFLLCL